jgi:ribonuclease Z
MRPLFRAELVNGAFGDPVLYVDFQLEKRALLFDLGDLKELPPRKILRVSDVFVSHAHMDHFIGFDWLLRICLGRERRMRLFGPPGFLDQTEHKLRAYTWNLVENYVADFSLRVFEIAPDGAGREALFTCRTAFRREQEAPFAPADAVLLDEDGFRVRCTVLDHKTPCLAFALEEKQHVNVWKSRLTALGLPTGPWLQSLKRAVLAGLPDDTPIRAWWREDGRIAELTLALGALRREVIRIVPGQKIAYVTDAAYHPRNAERITAIARDADLLFIEAASLDAQAPRAAAKFHLTARQAGELARRAGAKLVVPFHVSPIHHGAADEVRAELRAAFGGTVL